jgi:hypothetical protein
VDSPVRSGITGFPHFSLTPAKLAEDIARERLIGSPDDYADTLSHVVRSFVSNVVKQLLLDVF